MYLHFHPSLLFEELVWGLFLAHKLANKYWTRPKVGLFWQLVKYNRLAVAYNKSNLLLKISTQALQKFTMINKIEIIYESY
jgi:hypothetical protein